MDYVKSWRITPEDVERLRGLESLAELPAAFWDYLTSIPHFTGRIKALEDGQLWGDRPIEVSPEVREMRGDAKVEFDLVGVEGPSAEVALISEALLQSLIFRLRFRPTRWLTNKRAS
jgi:hypothetical protein